MRVANPLAVSYTKKQADSIFAENENIEYMYAGTFTISGWSGRGPYTQTATLTPLDGGGNVEKGKSVITSPAMCEKTTSQSTNQTLQQVLSLFNDGYSDLSGINKMSTTLFEKPTSDIEVIWTIRGAKPQTNN